MEGDNNRDQSIDWSRIYIAYLVLVVYSPHAVVLPSLLMAFGIFGLLTKYFGPSHIAPETLCRKCGYILMW
jgi:hypothetical protein